ncbi:hypothetical protein CR513_08159, partial [Mucuna pruriens]
MAMKFYSSIHEIRENLIETYSMKKDYIACCDIESKIFNSKQGTLSITKYYVGLVPRIEDVQSYSIAHTRLFERVRIFKFLHGLNSKYDPIRVQILGKEKLPFLFESEET